MPVPSSERYRFEKEISSKGSFGQLWLATDTLLDRPVAIKRPRVTLNEERRQRFLTEARMLARLNHPNITQIYTVFLDENEGINMVMEYVDGKDLAEIIAAGNPLPLDWVLDVVKGILRALSYAHAQGIVHRDVKPGNLIVAGNIKLTDFGLANLKSLLEKGSQHLAGTPAYMAPEQIEGEAIDGRTDLYSLGVLFFELLTNGRRPFESSSPVILMSQHLSEDPPPVRRYAPKVPAVLEEVVMRLMGKYPEDRYPSADAVLAILENIHTGPRLNNLPVPLTPFIGRHEELAQITGRLQDPECRLLTLLGSGGIGKTRLALEAAARLADGFSHGVYFVSLATLPSAETILPTIAQAINFPFQQGSEPRDQLLDFLRQKEKLIILDSFEYLLEGVHVMLDILREAPKIKFLVTSRVKLNAQGEHLYRVNTMQFPTVETIERLAQQDRPAIDQEIGRYSSVKLFVQSAQRVWPEFELTAANVDGTARICHRVQGIPLALELAASWVEVLSPREIAAEISKGLDILENEKSGVPERQRSIRAVFDYSWNLLTDQEQEVFQALSIFRGGFTRDVADEITGASLRDLISLVQKSLLIRTPAGRYEMHGLLRQYAAGKLAAAGKSIPISDAHAAYYCEALQAWNEHLQDGRQQAAVADLQLEIENARAGWEWAVKREQVMRAAQGVVGLARFYSWRGLFQEGESICRLAIENLAVVDHEDRLLLLGQLCSLSGFFNRKLGRKEQAKQQLQRSLSILARCKKNERSQLAKAHTFFEQGQLAADDQRETARQLLMKSLLIFRKVGSQYDTARALYALGEINRLLGYYDHALPVHQQGLEIREAMEDQRGIAASLAALGSIASYQGRLEEGEQLIRQSIEIYHDIGDLGGMADASYQLGACLDFQGRFKEAYDKFQENVVRCQELGISDTLVMTYLGQAWSLWQLGQYPEAEAMCQSSLAISQASGFQLGIASGQALRGGVLMAEGKFHESRPLFQESEQMLRRLGQRDELGWTLPGLGLVEIALGDHSQAKKHAYEALQTAADLHSFAASLWALVLTFTMLAILGELEQALELFTVVLRYPSMGHSKMVQDLTGQMVAYVTSSLPPDVVTAARKRGQARELASTIAELVNQLGDWAGE